MPTGTVVRFRDGFGFISLDGASPDDNQIFVHQNDIVMDGFRSLKKGQKVSFETEQNAKGLKATDIKVISSESDYKSSKPKSSNDAESMMSRLVEVLSDDKTQDPLISREEADYILGKQLAHH